MKKSLRWKMIICYILASIVPLILCLSVFIGKTSSENKKNLYSNMNVRSTQSAQRIADTLNNVDKMFVSVIKNADLREFLYSNYPNIADALSAFHTLSIQSQIAGIANNYTVRLYNTNHNVGISALTNNSMDTFVRKYGETATHVSTRIQMHYFKAYGTQPERIGFCRVYSASDTSNPIYVTIEVPVKDIFPETALECVLLMDNTPLLSSDSDKFAQLSLNDEELIQIKEKGTFTYNDESYLAIISPLSDMLNNSAFENSLSLLCLSSYQSYEQAMEEGLIDIVTLCLLCAAFSLVVTVIFTRKLTSRITVLKGKTRRVLNLDFDISEPIQSPDELGDLEADIYDMASALFIQIEKEKAAIQAKGEQRLVNEQLRNAWIKAEISSLRHQINPHYLFNTLESIRMHLLLKGDRETAKILQVFASSYRKSMETDNSDYTLKDELETVNNFLTVQKYRLGERFDSDLRIDEDSLDCKIPRLILQPLVENAFFHGIELSNTPGHLIIEIRHMYNCLSLMVSDNGIGIPEEKLLALKEELKKPDYSTANGIGIKNIVLRLRLLYGPDTFFDIDSIYGSGTTVRFEIPYCK